ncbi:trypsin-like peptidase domain-containing protein [Streptomyces sp. NPDC058451]|uniref:VMAP-C domain-containing protein n=1 Tax=Streptomyces sp. NPDC058451 TaxID=3346506 RepID=UPI003658D9A0
MHHSAQTDAAHLKAFVSVRGQEGFVGAAVMITDTLVLTCAHVVNSALGRDRFDPSVPGHEDVIRLRMPHVARDQELVGRVVRTMWRPARAHPAPAIGAPPAAGRLPYFGDLAVLKLDGPAPEGAEPAPFLPERDGHEVTGLWASGNTLTIMCALPRAAAPPWIVLDVVAGSVHEGFSGGPLWDRKREAVVGIVVATHLTGPGAATGSPGTMYAIGLPTIESELPDLPPVAVPMAGRGRQQMLAALERLLPGTRPVLECEQRLSARLGRPSKGPATDLHRLLALAMGVRRGVPELLEVVRHHLTDTGAVDTSGQASDDWERLTHAARTVSPRELLTVQQRRDLVGLLTHCRGTNPMVLLGAVLPYADELPLVSGLADVTDVLEGYDPLPGQPMPPLLQAVVRIGLAERASEDHVSDDLDAWVERTARRFGITEPALDQFRADVGPAVCVRPNEPHINAAPRIQVELLPIAPGNRFTYQIWVWSSDGRHEVVMAQDSEVSSEQVVEAIRTVLRNEVHEHPDHALVEFFVAPAWLRLEVDTWKLRGNEEDGAFFLGISRRVVLRSSGRTRETYASWKRRTEALASSQPLVLDQRSVDPAVVQARLEAAPEAGIVIVCCDQQHQSKVLRQCLQAGVHTVLWHREEHNAETAKQLLALVEGISHADIPETVRLERARALAEPDRPTHHGRRLSLLYDGPDHRPPPLAPDAWALTQP